MTTDDYELHDRLDALSTAAADRDVLVSLAVPPDGSLADARERVESDYAEATQLDEREFPQPLVDALEEVRGRLNAYEELPENGLAIFAGAPDGDLEVAVFDDLPAAVTEDVYEHANEFDLEPLESVTEPASTHGLLVIERGGAAIGRLADEGVDVVETLDSDVPGKSSAGGQSAERFERDRERQKREFFDTVAERAERAFLGSDGVAGDEPVDAEADDGGEERRNEASDGGERRQDETSEGDAAEIDGLLLGGTTGTVENFREEAELDHRLEERIVGEFAVEYASEQGLRQLAEKGRDALAERDRADARDALEEFFEAVRDREDSEPAAYGSEEVDDALEYDAVDTALLSTALNGGDLREFGDRTEAQGGETVVVPDDFSDGERFAEAFDGVGALLRFPVE